MLTKEVFASQYVNAPSAKAKKKVGLVFIPVEPLTELKQRAPSKTLSAVCPALNVPLIKPFRRIANSDTNRDRKAHEAAHIGSKRTSNVQNIVPERLNAAFPKGSFRGYPSARTPTNAKASNAMAVLALIRLSGGNSKRMRNKRMDVSIPIVQMPSRVSLLPGRVAEVSIM